MTGGAANDEPRCESADDANGSLLQIRAEGRVSRSCELLKVEKIDDDQNLVCQKSEYLEKGRGMYADL